jgi:glycosyltransferase involved in cell wall biosynthesis
MIRVAFVVADLDMGGAERHVVTLAPALDRSRFEATVFCLTRPGTLFESVERSGVAARSMGGGGSRLGALRAAWRLFIALRRDRPDVVVTSGFQAGIVGRLVGRASGATAIVSWKHNIGHLGLVGLKERWTEKLMTRMTTRYLGVCFSQIPYLVDEMGLDPSRIGVVYNSVSANPVAAGLSRAAIGLGEHDAVIGVVAVLRQEKDHATILHAVAELQRARVPATLVIVGDGPERPALERLTAELGIGDCVRFLGQRSDVPDLLPLFDVVALASFTIECFPYAILEAMAAARPVVVTAVGGLPEMVEDGVTGFLVPPQAPMAMAAALAELLRDADRAARLGVAGRDRLARRWPFADIVSKVESELSGVLTESTIVQGGLQ